MPQPYKKSYRELKYLRYVHVFQAYEVVVSAVGFLMSGIVVLTWTRAGGKDIVSLK